MTKCLLPICACLGGLVLLAGCAGSPSAPPQSQPQVTERVEGVTPLDQGQEQASDRRQDARDIGRAAEPNETRAAPVEKVTATKQNIAEPNETTVATSQEVKETREVRPVEPDIPSASEPNGVKPTPAEDLKSEIPNPQSPVPPTAEPNAVKPDATPNPQSEIHNPKSIASFLTAYAELLRSDVHEDGAVDYTSLHRRRLELKQIFMKLGELDPNSYAAWSSDEKLAFWVNVYNLKMLEIIARNYPIQSSWWLRLTWPPSDIRHIAGIWTDYKFIVMGEEFTLAEVEQRFFHRTFADPRAYLALTCACWSGPPLRRKPYSGDHLAQQLDEQVKAFLASAQGLRIDRRAMVLHLSAILKPTWRGKEFLARYGTDKKFKDRDPETRAVLNFLTGYLSRDDAYFLETENYTLEYTNFDWRLNDTSRAN